MPGLDTGSTAFIAKGAYPGYFPGVATSEKGSDKAGQTDKNKAIVASPRGFCAGVSYAIDIVNTVLEQHGPPVYVRHEIVHNRHVVEDLRSRGARFVEDLADVPSGSLLVFSAHGVSPAIRQQADQLGLRVVDATCPLVTKVHLEAARFAGQDYDILLIGHRGHVEVEGTLGHAPERMQLVETVEDVAKVRVRDPERVAVVTQTTLSVDDTREIISAIRERFPAVSTPGRDDICYATQNRQEAVKALALRCRVVFVLGSPNSSNANRLVEVARSAGAHATLIETAADISEKDLAHNLNKRDASGRQAVGVTAGASTPELLVQQTLARLRELGSTEVEELRTAEERVTFSLPAKQIENA
ncbi:MAG: 4-hydroxy-3-methylbut-2-enyl diphosphate reductase [bacterium]